MRSCARGCADPACLFPPHPGRYVFESAIFDVRALSAIFRDKPLLESELFLQTELLMNEWFRREGPGPWRRGRMYHAALEYPICRVSRSLRPGRCAVDVLSGSLGACAAKPSPDARRGLLRLGLSAPPRLGISEPPRRGLSETRGNDLSAPARRGLSAQTRRGLVLHWEAKSNKTCVLGPPYDRGDCHRGDC